MVGSGLDQIFDFQKFCGSGPFISGSWYCKSNAFVFFEEFRALRLLVYYRRNG